MIADDHAIVREGLKQIVTETRDMVVAGEAQDGHQAIELARRENWDVVLLDLAMPGRGGMDALRQLNKERPNMPVLILSIYAEDQYALRALKAGAAGYLTKDSAPQELVTAIRKIASGGKYITTSLAEKLAVELAADPDKLPHERLSDREYQVMLMLASGQTVGQIADELSLSVKTISTNRTRLLKKMNMKTNAELTVYALKGGLVS
jgi:DNA-binding NarL/FixJ family response regulator